jgi:hypothetical protein
VNLVFKSIPQWINWIEVPPPTGKPRKVPVDWRTGVACDPHNSDCWTDYETACSTGRKIGFVFTENDPFWFFDLDNCFDDTTNNWKTEALALVNMFPGALVQVSNSNRGLHVFGCGQVPPHACKNTTLGLEFYTSGRYCAMTGNMNDGDPTLDFTGILTSFIPQYFPVSTTTSTTPTEWTTAPVPEWSGHITDEDLLAHARKTVTLQNKMTGSVTFDQLWCADPVALGAQWKSHSDTPYDASSADQSLACRLAFWTGKDCTRIERLMRSSALVREKWDRHKTYLKDTILKACASTKDVCHLSRATIAPATPGTIEDRVGHQLMSGDQQKIFFKGMVYIADENRILCPNGESLKEASFKAKYGGYEFVKDCNGVSQADAWKAFTQSQILHFPKADSTCFRPDLPFGQIIKGRVNTYLDPKVELSDMSPQPFLDHLTRLVPNERDRTILLCYMAAVVQHKGVKFQWAPLIQGCEGNGKTLLTRAVAYAVGDKYTHIPKADDIDNKFNGWLKDKIFIGVEDIYVPDSRRDLMETLKPMITGDRMEIQKKGADQTTLDVCANFILNSNHKDAIIKSKGDRRYAIFYSAQQHPDHLHRDGMTGNYFPDLYNWLRRGGYGAVAKFLNTYQIAEQFNPATSCTRVPETSSTTEAISVSLGKIESEIIEMCDEHAMGFANDWISSYWLKRRFPNLSTRKLGEIVESIGYVPHPHLIKGRVNNPLLLDGSIKSKLYIRSGSVLQNILTPAKVAERYVADQQACENSAIRERLSST